MDHARGLLRGLILRFALGAFIACAVPVPAAAQSEGGLYIAGYEVDFERAASDGLSRNPPGQRFFVLVLPPHTSALTPAATKSAAAARERVIAANGVILVCQRDIDSGAVDASKLVAGVVAVRGWPPAGSNALPAGQRYFADENPAKLPQANEALRRLRSTCT
jgi:hypothetical protein